MKVLVVSYLPWRNDVSVGNTFTNLFDGLKDKIEFAHIYFKGGMPDNEVAKSYFYIPEKELIKSILNRKGVGYSFKQNTDNASPDKEANGELYNRARQMRWESMLLAQDLIGLLGRWKTVNLDKFIDEFQPDIVFGPLGRMPVGNEMMIYIKNKYRIPVIAYAWDDHYTLKKSLSPFGWIRGYIERKYIRKCAAEIEFLYTITEEMKDEYEGVFNKECKMLYKGYDFTQNDHFYIPDTSKKTKIVYMGNIGAGRWNELAKLVQAILLVNKARAGNKPIELDIYTMSPCSDEMKKALDVEGAARLMTPVPSNQIVATMQSADILLHVEPTMKKDLDFFRLSFSTKIVDYLYSQRCILAVGGKTAATEYLRRNDSAIVEYNADQYKTAIEMLVENPQIISTYANRAWECGKKNHNIAQIQSMLYNDFDRVCSMWRNRGQALGGKQ